MKKLLWILCATLITVSCGKSNDTPKKTTDPETFAGDIYKGSVTVGEGGSAFVQSDIAAWVTHTDNKIKFILKSVKFAAAMPVKIDVSVPEQSLTKDAQGNYSFSAESIVPVAMGGPNDKYTMTKCSGKLSKNTDGKAVFDFTCICYQQKMTYSGVITQK